MRREEMVRISQPTLIGRSPLEEALVAALAELALVGDALGTDETGDGLVAVARAAHDAEQREAASQRLKADVGSPLRFVDAPTHVTDSNEKMCLEAAKECGLTEEQAVLCKDGDHDCPKCPWSNEGGA